MSLHLVAVNYRSAGDVPPLVASLARQDCPDWTLTLVDNSEDPDESARLTALVDGQAGCSVLAAPRNLGYLNALPFAADAMPDLQESDWLGLCNVDLTIESTDFVRRLVGGQGAAGAQDTGALAPAVVSDRTGLDQNPHLRSRPGLVALIKWRVMFASVDVARVTVWLIGKVGSLFARGDAPPRPPARSGPAAVEQIYAPHGSILLFSPAYRRAGGALGHPVFLFGEEITVAEECREHGLAVHYDPSFRVIHREHASTGLWRSRTIIGYQKQSADYIVRRLTGGAGLTGLLRSRLARLLRR